MTAFEGMDPKVWWRVATVAEGRGITVREVLDEAKEPVVSSPVLSRLQVLGDEVSAARRTGFRVPRRQTSPSEDRAWAVEQTRRKNLESFRNMTEVWS